MTVGISYVAKRDEIPTDYLKLLGNVDCGYVPTG